jgi:serine/threonine protein kinase
MATKEGWLQKQSGVLKGWKKRWYSLQGDRLLYYEKPGKKEQGVIEVKQISGIETGSEGKRALIKFNLGGHAQVLSPDTAKEAQEWVAALSKVASSGGGKAAASGGSSSGAAPAHKPSMDDYTVISVLGKGSFGKVQLVRSKLNKQLYAMKLMEKRLLQETDQVGQTITEKQVLFQVAFPFCVSAHATFQTPDQVVMVLDYVPGGDLFGRLKEDGKFSEPRARLYAAELALAIGHLHKHGFIYRDLKPENILVDRDGHIKMTDFGLVKSQMSGASATTTTFCGTPEYIAPEMLQQQPYTKAVDWWSYGILIYEMLAGIPPFYDENTNRMYRRIISEDIQYPSDFSPQARSLIGALCDRNPSTRLGSSEQDVEEIKSHPFFASLNWQSVYDRKYTPEWIPHIAGEQDTHNFDPEDVEGGADDVSPNTIIQASTQDQFKGFTCTDDTLI